MTHSCLLIYRDLYDCSIDKSGEILWEVRATWEVKKGKVTTEWKTPRKKYKFLPHLPHLVQQTVTVLPCERGRIRPFLPTSLSACHHYSP